MRKKLLSLALAVVMCLSLAPVALAAEGVAGFNDVPQGVWYWDDLEYALYNGYISGTSSDTFSPNAPFSRGMCVTILGRMVGAATTGGSSRFEDVSPESWYGPYVAWAADKGYVNGVSKTEFKPDQTITFQEMAVILDNYIKKSGVSLSGYTPSEEYTDAATVSTWAKSSVEAVRGYGLLPTVDGAVRPRASVSRAEATVALVRLAKAAGLGHAPVEQPKPPNYRGDSQVRA